MNTSWGRLAGVGFGAISSHRWRQAPVPGCARPEVLGHAGDLRYPAVLWPRDSNPAITAPDWARGVFSTCGDADPDNHNRREQRDQKQNFCGHDGQSRWIVNASKDPSTQAPDGVPSKKCTAGNGRVFKKKRGIFADSLGAVRTYFAVAARMVRFNRAPTKQFPDTIRPSVGMCRGC